MTLKDKREEFDKNSSLLYTQLSSLPPLPKESDESSKQGNKWRYLQQVILLCCLLVVIFVFGYHCPIYRISHLHCPGCGMTRAAISLIQGDLVASLSWHALLIPTLVIFGLYFLLQRKNSKMSQGLLWIWIFLLLVYWIYRLIFIFPNVS